MKYVSCFFFLVAAVIGILSFSLYWSNRPYDLVEAQKVVISNGTFFLEDFKASNKKRYEIILELDKSRDRVPSCWIGDKEMNEASCKFMDERLDMAWTLKNNQGVVDYGSRTATYGAESNEDNTISMIIGNFRTANDKPHMLTISNNQDFRSINKYNPRISIKREFTEAGNYYVSQGILQLGITVFGGFGIVLFALHKLFRHIEREAKRHQA